MQQPYGPTANPYAPPMYRHNGFVPAGATAGAVVQPGLRKLKLGLGIAQLVSMFLAFVFFGVGISMRDDGIPLLITGGVLFGIWYLLLFAYLIANVIWSYKFWSWIPPEQRWTNLWKKYISPGMFVGFMFIPYFNIYWLFVTYLGIADVLERMRVQYPCSKPPAKNIAMITAIVGIVFYPAAPFLQYMFQKHVEEMANEMAPQMPAPMA